MNNFALANAEATIASAVGLTAADVSVSLFAGSVVLVVSMPGPVRCLMMHTL